MGYRLNIAQIKEVWYGTKLYGYGIDLSKLLSYQFLVSLDKIDGKECWDYGAYNYIVLDKNEFKEFIKLYDEDLFNNPVYYQQEKNEFINKPEIQKLLKSKCDKLLSWL